MYAIDISELKNFSEIVNVTFYNLHNSEEMQKSIDEFREFVKENNYDNLIDAWEEFIQTDEYYYLEDSSIPMVNYVHILQQEPLTESVELLFKLTHTAQYYYIEIIDAHVIGLTGAGADLSEYIELAYWLADGYSPIEANDITFLDEDVKKLILWCRKEKPSLGEILDKAKEIVRKKEEKNE